jgi:hypothetical protein
VYSPFSCFAISSLSVLQVISSGLRVTAASRAEIKARYSAWLFVCIPAYDEVLAMTWFCSVRIRNAIAAGPGFPLAPPSVKMNTLLDVLVSSFSLFL